MWKVRSAGQEGGRAVVAPASDCSRMGQHGHADRCMANVHAHVPHGCMGLHGCAPPPPPRLGLHGQGCMGPHGVQVGRVGACRVVLPMLGHHPLRRRDLPCAPRLTSAAAAAAAEGGVRVRARARGLKQEAATNTKEGCLLCCQVGKGGTKGLKGPGLGPRRPALLCCHELGCAERQAGRARLGPAMAMGEKRAARRGRGGSRVWGQGGAGASSPASLTGLETAARAFLARATWRATPPRRIRCQLAVAACFPAAFEQQPGVVLSNGSRCTHMLLVSAVRSSRPMSSAAAVAASQALCCPPHAAGLSARLDNMECCMPLLASQYCQPL